MSRQSVHVLEVVSLFYLVYMAQRYVTCHQGQGRMHCKQFMQFGLYTRHKFRLLMESVLSRLETGQIASKLKLLEDKNEPSSISILEVGTHAPGNFA